MSDFLNYRDQSRIQWGKRVYSSSPVELSIEQIQLGAILRIADASELMAKNFLDLQRENQHLKESRDSYRRLYEKAERRITALKGAVTRQKKKRLTHSGPTSVSGAPQ